MDVTAHGFERLRKDLLDGIEVFEVALDGLHGSTKSGDRVRGGMVRGRGAGADDEADVRAGLSEGDGAGGTDA